MKKLLLLLTISLTSTICSAQISSINSFTQIEKIDGVIQMTTPINLQYAVKKVVDPSLNNLFVFAAAGVGHIFNGSSVIINDIPIVGGIGLQVVPSSPLEIGACAGINAVNSRFIVGVSMDIQIQPLAAATAKVIAPKKVKHNFSIGI